MKGNSSRKGTKAPNRSATHRAGKVTTYKPVFAGHMALVMEHAHTKPAPSFRPAVAFESKV